MKEIKVIVFTMAYNAQNTIGRTIESILAQTFSNFQYFILDNASTDDTEKIILDYCEKDPRIVPIHVNKNDPPNGGAFFHTLTYATDGDYIVWCDADDTYTPDFLENMVTFAEENQLDIAACGYDKVDGITGETIKHRALEENLLIRDDLFATKFIQYRGFMSYLWGKLYSISFLRGTQKTGTFREERICNDSVWVMQLIRHAKRFGVYGKAMYQYYQYPRSLSHTNIECSLCSYQTLWDATKEYIEGYGSLSKLNEDFLYAIYLSLVEEAVENIITSQSDTWKKIELLTSVFDNPVWTKTRNREADPMFRNLAARKEFAAGIKDKILDLPEIEDHDKEKEKLFSCL